MVLSKKTDHVDEALTRPVEQFKGKAVIEGLITALVNQIQDLENVAFQLGLDTSDSLRRLDTSVGVQLDGYGSIVGEDRLNRDDDTYRKAIRLRELINRASGTPEEIYTIFNSFREGTYEIREDYPAAFRLIAHDAITLTDPTPAELTSLLQDTKAAGVGANFVYGGFDYSSMFKFASGDTLESSSAYGFGNDTGTTGGHWADVYDPDGVGEVTLLKTLAGELIRTLSGDFVIE